MPPQFWVSRPIGTQCRRRAAAQGTRLHVESINQKLFLFIHFGLMSFEPFWAHIPTCTKHEATANARAYDFNFSNDLSEDNTMTLVTNRMFKHFRAVLDGLANIPNNKSFESDVSTSTVLSEKIQNTAQKVVCGDPHLKPLSTVASFRLGILGMGLQSLPQQISAMQPALTTLGTLWQKCMSYLASQIHSELNLWCFFSLATMMLQPCLLLRVDLQACRSKS